MNKTIKLDKDFWENRYSDNLTGWDIGHISTPMKAYIDQINNKNLKILIPGVGNGHEAEYLWNKGFKNIYVLDIAKIPLKNLKNRINLPAKNFINTDFFNLQGTFDLILEQTFFCAIHPNLRQDYAIKMHELLSVNGKIAGLFFDFELTEDGPPFGGDKEEYLSYFDGLFKIKTLERAYNSIKPRKDRELFFIFEKKQVMTLQDNTILSHEEIKHKIRRIAYQIYESNVDEKEIILAGIDKNGYILAKKLKATLLKISNINPVLCKVSIDKKNPRDSISTSLKETKYQNKSIVLVDDVLNSGTTLIYGVKHFLNVPLKQFKTAVLVNRNHKKYPVKADFKGISLSTSINEHVEVILEGKEFKASLV